MSKARQTVETLRTVLVAGDVTNANFTGADLEISKGGTGASSTGAARTALGVAIGTDVQAYDATILVDGDIGTSVLAPDGDGSGLTGVDSLPSQTSQSGKFLTTNGSAASWGEAGGAWDLLGTVTASGSSTVNIEGLFTSSYDVYKIVCKGVTCSASGSLFFARFKTTSYLTSNYAYRLQKSSFHDTTYEALASGSASQIQLAYETSGGPDEHTNVIVTLFDPLNTATRFSIIWDGLSMRSGNYTAKGGGLNTSTSAITGMQFYVDSGTTSGTFQLYGLKNS